MTLPCENCIVLAKCKSLYIYINENPSLSSTSVARRILQNKCKLLDDFITNGSLAPRLIAIDTFHNFMQKKITDG